MLMVFYFFRTSSVLTFAKKRAKTINSLYINYIHFSII